MNFTTLSSGLKLPDQPCAIQPASLYSALKKVDDQRSKRGRSYSMPFVLTLLILAKLAGETTPQAIAQWVRLRSDWIKVVFGRSSARLPCANTYKYVCEKLDLAQLNQVLAAFFAPELEPAGAATSFPQPQPQPRGRRHLALDGKTLRGTVSAPPTRRQKVHLLALYDVKAGVVLQQLRVESHESEVSGAPRLLKGRALNGCVLTADAFHTQKNGVERYGVKVAITS